MSKARRQHAQCSIVDSWNQEENLWINCYTSDHVVCLWEPLFTGLFFQLWEAKNASNLCWKTVFFKRDDRFLTAETPGYGTFKRMVPPSVAWERTGAGATVSTGPGSAHLHGPSSSRSKVVKATSGEGQSLKVRIALNPSCWSTNTHLFFLKYYKKYPAVD